MKWSGGECVRAHRSWLSAPVGWILWLNSSTTNGPLAEDGRLCGVESLARDGLLTLGPIWIPEIGYHVFADWDLSRIIWGPKEVYFCLLMTGAIWTMILCLRLYLPTPHPRVRALTPERQNYAQPRSTLFGREGWQHISKCQTTI